MIKAFFFTAARRFRLMDMKSLHKGNMPVSKTQYKESLFLILFQYINGIPHTFHGSLHPLSKCGSLASGHTETGEPPAGFLPSLINYRTGRFDTPIHPPLFHCR